MGGVGKGEHSDFRLIIIKIELVIPEITLKDYNGDNYSCFSFSQFYYLTSYFYNETNCFSIPLVAQANWLL